MYGRAWLKGAAERALKTAAQALLAVLGADTLGIHEVDWVGALSVAAMAAVASILTSVATPEFVAGTPASRRAIDDEHGGPSE